MNPSIKHFKNPNSVVGHFNTTHVIQRRKIMFMTGVLLVLLAWKDSRTIKIFSTFSLGNFEQTYFEIFEANTNL